MKKICFIGTSHLAALAHAWLDTDSAHNAHMQASFFVGGGTSLYEACFLPKSIEAPDNSRLAANFQRFTMGESRIILKNYDYFVFHGLDFPIIEALELSSLLSTKKQFFSEACLIECLSSFIENLPITPCIKHTYQNTECRILVSLAPKTSNITLQQGILAYQNYLLYAEILDEFFLKALKEIFNYPRIILVYQPTETLANPFFTKTEYLNQTCYKKHQDYWHKTPDYGKAVLKKILTYIEYFEI